MSEVSHYSKAKLLWKNVAYCDQWKKVMAVYDERDHLRAVIKENDSKNGEYNVLLIGDSTQTLYIIEDIELGSANKNLEACFKIRDELQFFEPPTYLPSFRRSKQLYLDQIFIQSESGTKRTGGFRATTEDAGEKIAEALKCYEASISRNVEVVDCCFDYIGYSEEDEEKLNDPDYIYHNGDPWQQPF